MSILSKPRTTRDVDVVAWLPDHDEWPAFLADGERHGIVPRIPDALGFALSSRVLLLRHDRSGVPIDLSMGALPFEENAVRRAVPTDLGALRVPLPMPEDLLVMKAVAHRSRDMVDIESILSAHADVDEKWVVSTVREFAEALDSPEQGATRACLSPASPQSELAGLRATCRIDGSGPGCIRDDRVATVTLKTPITWSLCTP